MSGDKLHIITHAPKLFTDGAQQGGVIALGKIGSSDGAVEKHIAHQGDFLGRIEEHHVPRGVSRTVPHLQLLVSDLNQITLVKPTGRFKRLRRWEAEHFRLISKIINPELVFPLRSLDGNPKPP